MTTSKTFLTDLIVTVADINYGAHVGNDRFLLFFHEARIRMLRAMELSELNIGDGVGLIMSEAHVKYRAQALMGESLQISVAAKDVGRARFTLLYGITNKATGKAVADGWTLMSSFDYGTGRVARLPESFAKAIAGYDAG